MSARAFTPADQRERDRIREDVGVNMCVEAGAGTGKTTVLVDRIVHLLASGHADVQRLAVITFTEKAAAELAGRVRQGLEEALDLAPAGDARERIERALHGLNQAHMETIHAFAAGILRERPVEADLDPGFEVLDQLPAQLAFETAYDEWLAIELAADAPPPALFDILNLGLKPENVREAAEALNRHREMLPLAYEPVAVRDARDVVRELDVIAGELDALYDCKMKDESDAARAKIPDLREYVDSLSPLLDREDALRRALCSPVFAPGQNVGHQGHYVNPDDCRAIKAKFKEYNTLIKAAVSGWRSAATAALVEWLQGFVAYYADVRRQAGKADFDDLLVWARDLLRSNDEVRAYFAAKFRHILVDEFQDTDPLQAEMIVRLCAEGAVPADWREATLRPGSLFVVGDPKQSIYRFRRADITMYDGVKRNMFGGAPVLITQNFRSAGPIIAWVNRTFGALFRAQEGVQPPYVPLAAHPAFAADDAVGVIRREISHTERRGSATALRRAEAELIASLIRDNVESGAWRVREGDPPERRAASYRDVVVVIPTRTELDVYEDAFGRAGVPYRHEGGRTFFQRQEVRELIAILRAIDDPGDGIATVAALRSAAFGCSDEDLLLYRHAGGRFDTGGVAGEVAGPVAESMRVLRELAALRYETPLPELVRATLERTRLVEFAMLQPQGEQVAANLLKIIDQARALSDATGGGLRAFVRWLKLNITRVSDETDAPISEETDDVVRIVTIHASKGLEFPIVIFANMDTDRFDRTNVIADRAQRRLYVKLGNSADGFRTPGYDDAEIAEKAHGFAEEQRQLYVAATRAKDRLFVPFVTTAGKDTRKQKGDQAKSLNDWLRVAGAGESDVMDIAGLPAIDGEMPVWRRTPSSAAEHEADAIAATRDAWLADHETLIAKAARPLNVQTATALKPEWEREFAGGDDVRRGRAADFGSAVHLALERIALRDTERIDAVAAAVAGESGLRDRAQEIAEVTRRALASDAVARALRSPRMLQEVPFSVALPSADSDPGGLAEGRIDLMWIEDGEIIIADFKTDNIAPAEADARALHYRNQALVYAWAASRATGLAVREVTFIFARPGVERVFKVDRAFLAEAESRIRSGAASPE